MIKRIVKLTFKKSKTDEFVELFELTKRQIRKFEGCRHLELVRCIEKPNVFFTISHWKSPEALEKYRQSDLFHNTWAQTKALFKKKAQAWSVELQSELP